VELARGVNRTHAAELDGDVLYIELASESHQIFFAHPGGANAG
jgi:hypothetical protein